MRSRVEARRAIVQSAERHRLSLPARVRLHVRPHSMRRLQWAVFVARQSGLVDETVLAEAGFRDA